MNTFQTRFATRLAMTAYAAFCTVAFSISPDAVAQNAPEAGHQGNRHQSMQAMQTREFNNLQQGRGMGMARVAETNGYPGPMHVLEHAEALELTDGQIERTRELKTRVRTRAPELGNQIVDAEKRLEAMFAEGGVNAAKMDSLLIEIAELRAHLRSLHLTAHLDQAAVLTETQIEQYKTLRSAGRSDDERRPMRRMLEMKRESTSGGADN